MRDVAIPLALSLVLGYIALVAGGPCSRRLLRKGAAG